MAKRVKRILGAAALTLCIVLPTGFSASAAEPNVDFIDVSHHNSESGLPLAFYQTIKESGVKGVAVKVSEGTTYSDPAASVNIANAKQAGLTVSAYHYARYTSKASARAEAAWFAQQLRIDGFDAKKDGYAVVDIEEDSLTKNTAKLTEYTNAFIAELKAKGFKKVDLYSGSAYYNSRLHPHSLHIDKPWLARYPLYPATGQPKPHFSNGKGAWQWASDYVFNGMSRYGHFDVNEDYAGKYTGKSGGSGVGEIGSVSLVNYMKEHGMDFSYDARAKLAKSYGIENYTGTAAQNLALLSKLQSGVKPAKPKPSPKPSTSTYTVVRGDTLSGIGAKLGVNWRMIANLNGLKSPYTIYVGQQLKINKSASPAPKTYTVKRGDTLSGIGAKLGVSWTSIAKKNGTKAPYVIYPGEKLKY